MLPWRLLVTALAAVAAAAFANALTAAVRGPENEVVSDLLEAASGQTHAARLHRERRQLRRNPNIFGLFFQLIGETRRDIQRTFNEIGRQVEAGIVDENTIANSTAASASAASAGASAAVTAGAEGASTTSERPRITRQEVLRILSRNWRGLTRLFNQEVEIAVNQSNTSAAEARRAFWDSLAPFLEPATTTPRSNATRARSG